MPVARYLGLRRASAISPQLTGSLPLPAQLFYASASCWSSSLNARIKCLLNWRRIAFHDWVSKIMVFPLGNTTARHDRLFPGPMIRVSSPTSTPEDSNFDVICLRPSVVIRAHGFTERNFMVFSLFYTRKFGSSVSMSQLDFHAFVIQHKTCKLRSRRPNESMSFEKIRKFTVTIRNYILNYFIIAWPSYLCMARENMFCI